MPYYEPTLSLDPDYYYIESNRAVYIKINISVLLPAGVDCHFDSSAVDPNDPSTFIAKYTTNQNGTSNQDHTYTDTRDIEVISNVVANDAAQVVSIIESRLASMHTDCYTISGQVYDPDGELGGISKVETGKEVHVIMA